MELKDLQSDLEALRELYRIIHCGGEEVASNVILGERSKLLLKNLLDGATKRVLETHKKIMAAAEHGISGNSCSSESGKWMVLGEPKPSDSSSSLKDTPDVTCNFVKESKYPEPVSSKDEDSPRQLTTREVISQQTRFTLSLDKPAVRKNNCEFTKKSSMKQNSTTIVLSKDAKQQGQRCDPLEHCYQASGDDKKLLEGNETNMKLLKSNETMRQSSICGLQCTPSVIESVASCSNSVAPGDNLAYLDQKEGKAVNNFSKDIDNIVEHIESHISALRLCSKLADVNTAIMPHYLSNMPTPVCPTVQAKENLVKRNELSHVVDPFSDRDDLQLIGQVSQGNGKEEDSNGSRHVLNNNLLNDLTSKRRRIQNKEIDQSCKHVVRSDSRLNKKVGDWNVFGMLGADGHKKNETTSCYVHGIRIPTNQGDITKRSPMPVKMPYPLPIGSRGKESSPNIAKFRPSLPSQSKGSKALRYKKRLPHEILPEQNKGGMGILRNKILSYHREPEEFSTTGSGSSGGEVYSSLSDDSSASVSSRFDHGAREGSSSSIKSSSNYRDDGESGRLYPTRSHSLIHPANSNPEKAVGRLRRLKNKLGLIFHHHHHHHHHHRYDHQENGTNAKSLWTSLHKLFHKRNRNDEDKSRKVRASNVPVKHQAGHFHALVGGLIRHLRHSKKSKASKGAGSGWPGNNQHKKNGKVNQFHWWQMFQRHGGVKLPNRRRVKVGFMSKKNQLKLPKFR